ncbi:Laminin subunit [Trichinella pseudospiralis]
MPKKLLFTVHLVLLFVCLHHYSTNGLVLKDQPSTTKAGSVYEKLLEDAVQNVRAQTEWLTANVTDIIEKLKITFSNQDSDDKTKNLNIDINNKNKDEMGTIDLMLAKVREQLSSIYKQLEMDQGVSKAASNVWEFVKEKFDLQAKSLNISLDNLKEQSEKFYASVITPQVEENVMQRINSMWQQVYEEMSNVKTILSNKEQLSKALETLKANMTDKSPESVKMIINEMTKGGSTEKQNLMNLISIAVGKRWTELMEHPEEITKLLKVSN